MNERRNVQIDPPGTRPVIGTFLEVVMQAGKAKQGGEAAVFSAANNRRKGVVAVANKTNDSMKHQEYDQNPPSAWGAIIKAKQSREEEEAK